MSAVAGRERSAARTDPGKVRARNEDAFLDRPGRGLWAVADGMGGHQNGHLASQLIVAELQALNLPDGFDERLHAVRRCLHWVNRRLAQELTLLNDGGDGIIGSTVVVLLIGASRAACLWAGDSRCYLWRGQRLFQLTRDHTVAPRAGARCCPLTRAIGARDELTLEVLEFAVEPGDALLLCSDGLYKGLSEEAMGKALSQPQPGRAVQYLFANALGGRAADNITAVVVRP